MSFIFLWLFNCILFFVIKGKRNWPTVCPSTTPKATCSTQVRLPSSQTTAPTSTTPSMRPWHTVTWLGILATMAPRLEATVPSLVPWTWSRPSSRCQKTTRRRSSAPSWTPRSPSAPPGLAPLWAPWKAWASRTAAWWTTSCAPSRTLATPTPSAYQTPILCHRLSWMMTGTMIMTMMKITFEENGLGQGGTMLPDGQLSSVLVLVIPLSGLRGQGWAGRQSRGILKHGSLEGFLASVSMYLCLKEALECTLLPDSRTMSHAILQNVFRLQMIFAFFCMFVFYSF